VKLAEDIQEWLDFCDQLVYEIRDFKATDYKKGVADGIEMAMNMLKEYLKDYPDFFPPKK